ncbi:helix-turn-helix domain-containing protein [Ekhidna sp.]|uniref:helix-turn-helix domain-containing protein n=1 Tax=Ekhidna sp. TaxID=2608089 RepID=UPI00329794DD
MKIQLIDLIIIFLAGAGLLICFTVGVSLLFRKRGINLTNKLLGLLLVLYTSTTLNGLMAVTGVLNQNQQLYFLPIIFSLSIGPLYYFFVRSKIEPSFKFSGTDYFHFIIPIIQVGFYLAIGFRSVEEKSLIWQNVVRPYVQYIEEGLLIVLGLFYLFKSLHLLRRKIPKTLWQKPVYKWLNSFTISFLILLFIHSSYEIASWIFYYYHELNIYNSPWMDLPLKLADVGVSFVIGINAYIYQNQSLIIPKQNKPNPSLDIALRRLFDEEKIYQNPELNMDYLAKEIGLPKNTISKSLAERGTTFRGLINSYRVEEFIQKAQNKKYEHLSLLGIAFESGFNSKASFNRIFKEIKGKSPSQYFQ